MKNSTSSASSPTFSQANKTTHAAVGVIQHENGLVLLAERPVGKPWAGYWEFPGGKVEVNEAPENALKRELQEELGITVTQSYPWLTRTFDYEAKYDAENHLESPAKTVKLHFFIVTKWDGEPFGLEKQKISWQNPEKINVGPMLPANTPIFSALNLPSLYAISNLHELGEEVFFERLKLALQNGLMLLQIREKQLSKEDLTMFIERVVEVASPYKAKVFISSNLELALELGLSGVHFNRHDLMQLDKKPVGLICGASCHNKDELEKARLLDLDYVLLSPVKKTLSHPSAKPLGWDFFRELITDSVMPVYALGGMDLSDLHAAKLHGAHGVAMQRNIW